MDLREERGERGQRRELRGGGDVQRAEPQLEAEVACSVGALGDAHVDERLGRRGDPRVRGQRCTWGGGGWVGSGACRLPPVLLASTIMGHEMLLRGVPLSTPEVASTEMPTGMSRWHSPACWANGGKTSYTDRPRLASELQRGGAPGVRSCVGPAVHTA